MSLLGLLVAVLVLCVVYWAVTKLMAAFGIGEPIHTVVVVVLVVLGLIYILGPLLGIGPTLRLY